jgi:hypothetical protein
LTITLPFFFLNYKYQKKTHFVFFASIIPNSIKKKPRTLDWQPDLKSYASALEGIKKAGCSPPLLHTSTKHARNKKDHPPFPSKNPKATMNRNPLSSIQLKLEHAGWKKERPAPPSPTRPPSKIPMKKPKASLFNPAQLEHLGRPLHLSALSKIQWAKPKASMTRDPLSSVWVQLKHWLKKRTSRPSHPNQSSLQNPYEKTKGLSLQSSSTRTSHPLQNPYEKTKGLSLQSSSTRTSRPPPPPVSSLQNPMEKTKGLSLQFSSTRACRLKKEHPAPSSSCLHPPCPPTLSQKTYGKIKGKKT